MPSVSSIKTRLKGCVSRRHQLGSSTNSVSLCPRSCLHLSLGHKGRDDSRSAVSQVPPRSCLAGGSGSRAGWSGACGKSPAWLSLAAAVGCRHQRVELPAGQRMGEVEKKEKLDSTEMQHIFMSKSEILNAEVLLFSLKNTQRERRYIFHDNSFNSTPPPGLPLDNFYYKFYGEETCLVTFETNGGKKTAFNLLGLGFICTRPARISDF